MKTPCPSTSPSRILIAEDSGDQAFMLRRILEEQGQPCTIPTHW